MGRSGVVLARPDHRRRREFDAEVVIDATELAPFVTWGTNPGQGVPLSASVPAPEDFADPSDQAAAAQGAGVHGSGSRARRCVTSPSTPCSSAPARTAVSRTCAPLPTSCAGHRVAEGVRMLVVPGSVRVRLAAEAEGLDQVFIDAGREWREAGCSMCLGMNPDTLAPRERSASTSNRNFEGRQGPGGRTHLVSPQVAAATAVRRHASARPADLRVYDRPGPDHGHVHRPHGHRCSAAAQQRRHRPDHPRRVPQADHPARL